MKKAEYYSTDYDFKDINIDPRFKICEKEMKISFVVWFAYAFITIATAYYLGRGPVENYKYIMGIPAWIVGSVIVTLIFYIIVLFITNKVFKNMDLNDKGDIKENQAV